MKARVLKRLGKVCSGSVLACCLADGCGCHHPHNSDGKRRCTIFGLIRFLDKYEDSFFPIKVVHQPMPRVMISCRSGYAREPSSITELIEL